MTNTQRVKVDMQRVEALLLSEALARQGIGPEARPTPNCPSMPVLADIADGRLGGSADQRRHVYSCRFCLHMIERMQRKQAGLRGIIVRFLYPLSWAACLALGIWGASSLLSRPATASPEVTQQIASLVDFHNHLDERVLDREPQAVPPNTDILQKRIDDLEREYRKLKSAFGQALRLLTDPSKGPDNTTLDERPGP